MQTITGTGLFFFVIIFFGLLLHLISKFTRRLFAKNIGVKFDIYFTGIIGTPVHEIGHAFFCILFRHKISEIKLFKPDPSTGTLGYVSHVYNKRNIYHLAGNFFIGIGPLLFGSLIIVFLIFLISDLRINKLIFSANIDYTSIFSDIGVFYEKFIISIKDIITTISKIAEPSSWKFWISAYVAICITSHMELSWSDIKGAWAGAVIIFLLAFIFSIILTYTGKGENYIKIASNNILNSTVPILLVSLIISVFGYIFLYLLLSIYTLIRNKSIPKI